MLTINEAIKSEEALAKESRACGAKTAAENHAQVAAWLKQVKAQDAEIEKHEELVNTDEYGDWDF